MKILPADEVAGAGPALGEIGAGTPAPRASRARQDSHRGFLSQDSAGAEVLLDLSLRELVRYYRHSSVGRLCQGIVHRLNTPLQVLSFQLELLKQKSLQELGILSKNAQAVSKRLQTLHSSLEQQMRQFRLEVEKLQGLTRDLAWQGVHEDAADRRYLDLNEVYHRELELYLADPFFKHRVEKNFAFQAGLPPVYGHYIDFSQSFRNLLDNALEAMAGAAQRHLTVTTILADGRRLLRLGDTGTGIAPEILPRIFEPFFTTKGTLQAHRAGLGLFMARRLLAPYGGEIEVESVPGETWMTVVLPV